MSCRGVLPKLDGAIFADTGWEPAEVYDYLAEVILPEAKNAGIPVHYVSGGHIYVDWQRRMETGERAASMPFFTEPNNPDAKEGRLFRQCTKEYKIDPVHKKLEDLCDGARELPHDHQLVTLWFGISGDEMRRMRMSKVWWIDHYYPLVFGLERPYHRHDCLKWLKENGFPEAPRSACIGCPYHDDAEWRRIKQRPFEWQQAVQFDAMIRNSVKQPAYLHRSLKPLPMVDLESLEDKGQQNWLSECEGMCGV